MGVRVFLCKIEVIARTQLPPLRLRCGERPQESYVAT
jgi:hypothetical protein